MYECGRRHIQCARRLTRILQGTADGFLENQLKVKTLQDVVHELGRDTEWNIRLQDGYDHSYYFISSFIADHINHHVKALKA